MVKAPEVLLSRTSSPVSPTDIDRGPAVRQALRWAEDTASEDGKRELRVSPEHTPAACYFQLQ